MNCKFCSILQSTRRKGTDTIVPQRLSTLWLRPKSYRRAGCRCPARNNQTCDEGLYKYSVKNEIRLQLRPIPKNETLNTTIIDNSDDWLAVSASFHKLTYKVIISLGGSEQPLPTVVKFFGKKLWAKALQRFLPITEQVDLYQTFLRLPAYLSQVETFFVKVLICPLVCI